MISGYIRNTTVQKSEFATRPSLRGDTRAERESTAWDRTAPTAISLVSIEFSIISFTSWEFGKNSRRSTSKRSRVRISSRETFSSTDREPESISTTASAARRISRRTFCLTRVENRAITDRSIAGIVRCSSRRCSTERRRLPSSNTTIYPKTL